MQHMNAPPRIANASLPQISLTKPTTSAKTSALPPALSSFFSQAILTPPTSIDQDFLYKNMGRLKPMQLLAVSVIFCVILFTMNNGFSKWLLLILTLVVGLRILGNWHPQRKKRLQFIQNTHIPSQLWQNDSLKALNLSSEQKHLVANGLKDFFLIHALYPKRPLAMPSMLVDKLWHAFILDTQRYDTYCKRAFGKIFHHIPDYQFKDKNHNIQMFTWQSACRVQGLSPAQAMTLPRLFAIDMVLGTAMASGITNDMPWYQYLEQMTSQYRLWHAQVFNNSSPCNDDNDTNSSPASNQCDVGITSTGDCSCGGSGDSSGGSCGGGGDSGGGCGGGCGGGD